MPDSWNASISFSRLTSFLRLASELVFAQFIAAGDPLLFQVDLGQHVTERLGADLGVERVVTVLFLSAEVVLFAQELVQLQRGQAGFDHDVVFKIEDPLQILQRHVKQ